MNSKKDDGCGGGGDDDSCSQSKLIPVCQVPLPLLAVHSLSALPRTSLVDPLLTSLSY